MITNSYETDCTLCPRECRVNRITGTGMCGQGAEMRVAKIMLHRYEEPPVSGTRGSGAVFFCVCNLRCGYCQNAEISHGKSTGEVFTPVRLAEHMLALQEKGAHNINLVTAAHFVPRIAETLRIAKPRLTVPVVYNSSAYEKTETLRLLDGLVDVYLPDFKYLNSAAAKKYSFAEDYPAVAQAAVTEMIRQTGAYREENGIAVRGTIIRHLVLPTLSRDGEAIMRLIAKRYKQARVSIMRQYTPSFNRTGDCALNRKVTTLEYNRVLNAAADAGLIGFMQDASSASSAFTPDFGK